MLSIIVVLNAVFTELSVERNSQLVDHLLAYIHTYIHAIMIGPR